jgi:hypothetical protein
MIPPICKCAGSMSPSSRAVRASSASTTFGSRCWPRSIARRSGSSEWRHFITSPTMPATAATAATATKLQNTTATSNGARRYSRRHRSY